MLERQQLEVGALKGERGRLEGEREAALAKADVAFEVLESERKVGGRWEDGGGKMGGRWERGNDMESSECSLFP